MTLEELDILRGEDCYDPQACCAHGDSTDETGRQMASVFDLAEAMLMLEDMGQDVSIHGSVVVMSRKLRDGGVAWQFDARKPTFSRAESSPAEAIRAAYEEWER